MNVFTIFKWAATSFAHVVPDLGPDGTDPMLRVAGIELADDNTLVIVTEDGVELHARIVITRKKETT